MFIIKAFAALAGLWLMFILIVLFSLAYAVLDSNLGAAIVMGLLLYYILKRRQS